MISYPILSSTFTPDIYSCPTFSPVFACAFLSHCHQQYVWWCFLLQADHLLQTLILKFCSSLTIKKRFQYHSHWEHRHKSEMAFQKFVFLNNLWLVTDIYLGHKPVFCDSLRKSLSVKVPLNGLSSTLYSIYLQESLPQAKVNIRSCSSHRIYLLCQSWKISHFCQIRQSLWQVTTAMVALSIILKGHLSENVCCR